MLCKFCRTDQPLCESHIIPELLFRPLYDDKHRAKSIALDGSGPRHIQKGIRERLFCQECEQFLSSRYERYFAEAWYQTNVIPNPVNMQFFEMRGLDGARVHLFHLSFLWRASVASDAQFGVVQLGPHEEPIRQLLRDEDPAAMRRYPVFGSLLYFAHNHKPCTGLVTSPSTSMFDGYRLYGFCYAACFWNFVVSSHEFVSPMREITIAADRIVLPTWPVEEFTPLAKFFEVSSSAAQMRGRPDPWE